MSLLTPLRLAANKVDWRDVELRARKTLAQTFVAVEPLLVAFMHDPSRASLLAVGGAAGSYLVSGAYNAARQAAAPITPTYVSDPPGVAGE